MSISYFLGANTKDGFHSLYDEFAAGPGEYLHIIKGGPGTGKSSFMRAIAHEAEQQGMEVQYILCSGDPDSIDGIFIPDLGEGWVDGTAPHATEARHFGFDSDYVNLGIFFIPTVNNEEIQRIKELNKAYKAYYATAYIYLSMTGAAEKISNSQHISLDRDFYEKLRCILSDSISQRQMFSCCKRVFLSSICCQGSIVLSESIRILCKLTYSINGSALFVNTALKEVDRQAEALGLDPILCLSPLDPSMLEAVLIPLLSLGFISSELRIDNSKPLVTQYDEALQSDKNQAKTDSTAIMKNDTLTMAIDNLRKAKALHDELESHYIRQMDFSALNAYTKTLIDKVFSNV